MHAFSSIIADGTVEAKAALFDNAAIPLLDDDAYCRHLVMPLMIKSVKSNGKSLHFDTSRLLKTNAPDVDDIAVGFRALKLNGYQNFPG
ncbi:hypothetical protein Tco_1467139 [Tanacetum coccineum]